MLYALCFMLKLATSRSRSYPERKESERSELHWRSREVTILGDPGAASRVGRKGATKVFNCGRKSPWVPTLTELFLKIQADAGSWLGTKIALYYCAQSKNSFSWVLFVSSYTTAIVLLRHSPGSFTKLVRARKTNIFYFPNQKRRNNRGVASSRVLKVRAL